MTDPRYQPNPLRPYYIPPSIGRETQSTLNTSATKSSPSFSFPDLDYSEYIPEGSPSVRRQFRTLFDKGLWKYTSIVAAQPFEVAKIILQTRVAQDSDVDEQFPGRASSDESHEYGQDEEEDEDEPNYFTSSAPFEQPTSRSPVRGRRGRPTRQESLRREQEASGHLIMRYPHSLMEALTTLQTKEGTFAIWRGTNSTFLYSVLLRTSETFFRSFFAALFGIAENDIALSASTSIPETALLASTFPVATVLIATAATAISALILAPIDAARTRLILTPADQEPRSLLSTVRTLSPAWLIPTHIIPIAFLTSTIPTFISTSTPLLLKKYLGLDPAMNPASWSVATFVASAFELSVKFPLETVLRRAQIATWTSPALQPPSSKSKRKAFQTVVRVPQSYRGILPTIWGIMRDEGYSESQKDRTAALMGKAPRRKRKGQGIEGLYRGWRVGFWGLVGVWGTSFVSGLQFDTESSTTATGPHGGKF